jgi:hypothetical protein
LCCGNGTAQPGGCGGGPAQLVASQGVGSLCRAGEQGSEGFSARDRMPNFFLIECHGGGLTLWVEFFFYNYVRKLHTWEMQTMFPIIYREPTSEEPTVLINHLHSSLHEVLYPKNVCCTQVCACKELVNIKINGESYIAYSAYCTNC